MSIEASLARYPRETLTRTPTPLDHLPTLSAELGIELYLKRDDLTDLALGGDKPRKLEYEIAHARANGADHLVTCGSAQSNHARLTTAAARRLGLGCTVVLSDDDYRAPQGNLLTVMLMGADIQIVDVDDHWDLGAAASKAMDRLRAGGSNPHFIPVSGTTPISCLGYVRGGLELADQLADAGINPDVVVSSFGTGGVMTASLTAFRERGLTSRFLGVSVNRDAGTCRDRFTEWWESLASLLDLDRSRDRGAWDVTDGYIGRGYGAPTPAALAAIERMARTEGILLDPVYTAKAAAGMLDAVETGAIEQGAAVVLIHTGGVPALFAYADDLADFLGFSEKPER